MTEPQPMVFVVDDDRSVLTAISRLLRAAGLASAVFPSAVDFLESCPEDAAGCLILDLAMPGLDGISLQEQLKSRGITLPVIFLTGRADVPMTVRAMKGGAADFLTKPPRAEELLRSVRAALEKDQAQRRSHQALAEDRQKLAALTPSEREVFDRVIQGHLNKQIAAALAIAERTVKFHRANLMQKMQVASVAELVALASRLGLAVPQPEPNPPHQR